jgi:hypothetical protein
LFAELVEALAYQLAEGDVRLVTTRGIPAAESADAAVADR